MLTLKFFIAIFSIFISPQIILAKKYNNLPFSLILFFSIIVSFSSIWLLTLLSYYLNLPDSLFSILALIVFIISLYYLLKIETKNQFYYLFTILIILILLLPILKYINERYVEWDAIVSWHRWGLELYNNKYNPIDAAYPILIPSLYSIIYKIVGTSDIWIFSKIAIYIFPIYALLLPIILFWESKNKIFIIIAILVYPYTIMHIVTYGEADIPVMLMGLYVLYALLSAEIYKFKDRNLFFKYLYAAILLAGLASITKQAGLIFIIFTLIYLLSNYKFIKGDKLVIILYIISTLYFLSFLILYYQNSYAGATGNINDLIKLSKKQDIVYLIEKFFYYPKVIPLFKPLKELISIEYLYMYIFIFAIFIYIIEIVFKKVKEYRLFALLNLIFLVIGFIMWAKIASYHPRNSLFVDDFLIIFIAISINYFINYLQKITFIKKYLSLILIFILLVISLSINDKNLYKNHIKYQKSLGDVSKAKLIAKIIKDNKNSCLKIYMNNYATMFNYYLKEYQSKLIKQPTDNTKYIRDFVENNCSKGSYILFRPSTSSYNSWYWIEKLIKEKKLIQIKDYLYFIKPNIKLPEDFFEYKTNLANIEIKNYINNSLSYSLDRIRRYDNDYVINGWAFNKKSKNGITYIVLKNSNNEYIVKTNKQFRADVANKYKLKNKFIGFKAYIYSRNIKEGLYDIYILYIDDKNQQHLIKTKRKINIKK